MLRFTSVTESVTWIQIHIALDLRTEEHMRTTNSEPKSDLKQTNNT